VDFAIALLGYLRLLYKARACLCVKPNNTSLTVHNEFLECYGEEEDQLLDMCGDVKTSTDCEGVVKEAPQNGASTNTDTTTGDGNDEECRRLIEPRSLPPPSNSQHATTPKIACMIFLQLVGLIGAIWTQWTVLQKDINWFTSETDGGVAATFVNVFMLVVVSALMHSSIIEIARRLFRKGQ